MTAITAIPPWLAELKLRELPDGSELSYEYAPVGHPTKAGTPRKRNHRKYFHTLSGESTELTSVTTLLKRVIPKGEGYENWLKKHGMEADEKRDTAATRGTLVHAALEGYMRTGNAPSLADWEEEDRGYVRALCSWLLARNPEPVVIEELVCDPTAGYAGRLDLIADHKGTRIMWDAKTQRSANIYPSAHLQLAMYARAHRACGGDPPDEMRVVVFGEDGAWREMPCEATGATVEAALAWARGLGPIEARCTAFNRAAREAT